MTDPILKTTSAEDLSNFLYKEKIDELKYRAYKGDRRARAEVIGELGLGEIDYTPKDEGMHYSDVNS